MRVIWCIFDLSIHMYTPHVTYTFTYIYIYVFCCKDMWHMHQKGQNRLDSILARWWIQTLCNWDFVKEMRLMPKELGSGCLLKDKVPMTSLTSLIYLCLLCLPEIYLCLPCLFSLFCCFVNIVILVLLIYMWYVSRLYCSWPFLFAFSCLSFYLFNLFISFSLFACSLCLPCL